MTPGEASKQGQLVTMQHPVGGIRTAAHVFDIVGGGVAWVDMAYSDKEAYSGHALHIERGQVLDISKTVEDVDWWLQVPAGDLFMVLAGSASTDDRARARELLLLEFGLDNAELGE